MPLKLIAIAAAVVAIPAAAVTVRFEPASPETGPFPTDALTVIDGTQKTGRRVNLPLPECGANVSTCEDLKLLNGYDGFSLNPGIRVRFSGAIDASTVREGLFLVALENLTYEEYSLRPAGGAIAINQVIYDPQTNTVYAKPDELLDQHRRYALVVTDAVRDRAGNAVDAEPAFAACIGSAQQGYCRDLAIAVRFTELWGRRFGTRRVVGGSVFTTLSATAWLEKARDSLPNIPPDFRPAGPKSVFIVSELASIVHRRQVRVDAAAPHQDAPQRTDLLEGAGRIAYGSYRSPNFLDENQTIPPTPTGLPLSLPTRIDTIAVQAVLPAGPKPPAGYPVAIAGHGRGSS